jgi:predicted DNA-binding WGR domain protein
MDNIMNLKEGKYTIETFARANSLKRQSAINLLSKLKKQGFVETSGGGKQKRIYTIHKLAKRKTNGFYDIVNKYSPEKLQPKFEHYVDGNYTIEQAIIDGIKIGDVRTLEATMHLFKHVTDWKRLFDIAKKYRLEKQVTDLYTKARKRVKCKRIPQRYLK